MPPIQVTVSFTTKQVGAKWRRSCVVKFSWTEKPKRSCMRASWCVQCAIDKLDGISTRSCYKTTGDPSRCWNCLSRFKTCAPVPAGITAYDGKVRWDDDGDEYHPPGELRATLIDALRPEADFPKNAEQMDVDSVESSHSKKKEEMDNGTVMSQQKKKDEQSARLKTGTTCKTTSEPRDEDYESEDGPEL